MKKENKIWLPIVIVLAVVIVGLFAGGIVVKMTIGKHEMKKGTGEVVTSVNNGATTEDSQISVKADDASYEAELGVEVLTRLENPDTYIIDDNPAWSYYSYTLEGLSAEELFYAWNEIYAKDGATFADEKVQAYFNGKSWYVNQNKTIEQLDTEYASSWYYYKANIDFIKQYMIDNNLTFTP